LQCIGLGRYNNSTSTRRPAAVVRDNAVDKSLLDLRLDGDEIGSVISAATNGRLAELHVAPVDDVARTDAVQARSEVVGTESRLHRRYNSPTSSAGEQLIPRTEPKPTDPNILDLGVT